MWILFLVSTMLAAFMASGCSHSPDRAETIEKSEVWRIGLSYPFYLDEEIWIGRAAALAVEKINQSGGIKGKLVELVRIDDKGSVTEGMRAAHRFINDPSIVAVIGHYNSRVTMAVAPVYHQAGLIMITPGATSPYLLRAPSPWIFRTIPDDWVVMDYMMAYLEKQGFERVGVFYADDEFGSGIADGVERSARAYGLEVVERTTIIHSHQMDPFVNRWKAFGGQALVIGKTFESVRELIPKLRAYLPDLLILGPSSLDYPGLISHLGDDAEDMLIATHFPFQSDRQSVLDLYESFQLRYGHPPDMFGALTYDTVNLLAFAIADAVGSSPESIAQALRSIKDWEGATGMLSYNPTGQFEGNQFYLKQVNKGVFAYLEP